LRLTLTTTTTTHMSKAYSIDMNPTWLPLNDTKRAEFIRTGGAKDKGWVVTISDETDTEVAECWFETEPEGHAFIEGYITLASLQSDFGITQI